MIIKKFLWAIVLLYQSSFAQFDSTVYKYGSFIDTNDIKSIIYTLASDSMLGRNTASEGQKRAENYLVEKFKEIGIAAGNGDSYLQEFKVNKREFLNIELSVDHFEIDSTYIFSISGIKGSEIESNAVVFAGYGINSDNYNDYEKIEAKGKSVFILPGEPIGSDGNSWINGKKKSQWNNNLELKIDAARLAGTRALFIVLDNFREYKSKYEFWLKMGALELADQSEEKMMPIVYIDKAAFIKIFDISSEKFDKQVKKVNVKGKPYSLLKNKQLLLNIKGKNITTTSSNVLGVIPGTDLKNEWVVISAHYDHLGVSGDEVYNGADDNASGITAILEIAQAFKNAEINGYKPRRSILFLLVSGEEKGLLGSKYFTDHPVYPLEKTMVDLNIDMVGRRDEKHQESNNYIYLIGADKLSKELNKISEMVNATYSQLDLDYTFNADDDPNRFYYRSDHYNFAKNNIPVIFYFNGTHEDYHQLSDTADKIELDALQKRAKLVFYTAWYLANKDKMLILD